MKLKSPSFYSRFACTLLMLASFLSNANNASSEPMWPGVVYDSAIPTFESVLGYGVGERITNHGDMLRYFEALERAAPDRIKLTRYATSWEGRSLIYATIATPDKLASIDEIAEKTRALSDPRVTNPGQAKTLIGTLPASVWLQYSVHGNEISSTDAAMFTAYHLLAAPNDPINQEILTNTVVFIDPLQNPDGRERFVSRYYATVGSTPSADRIAAENNEPWPRGRSNHYLFDMNRDWLAITQPETKGKIAAINHYKPQVVIDLHEMGGDQSYYFAPAAEPFNPLMTATQIANMDAIGRNHGKHFDAFGFDYFTREVFDAFYPGYGDSWPTFYGASASTYEVGSSRGELFQRKDGQILTYKKTVQKHFVASISTAEGAAKAREKLLTDFYQYQIDAIEQGKKNKERVYILSDQHNRAGAHRLATLMAEHGVAVQQANAAFQACGVKHDAGTYFIDTAQPRGKFVTTTFTDQVDMDADFIKEQERRRARNLGDQIYDVTGWSLPMMFNVQTSTCDKPISVDSTPVSATTKLKGQFINPQATVAYVVPWNDVSSVRFLTSALQKGMTLKSADEAFVVEGNKTFPAGSLIIETKANDSDLMAKVAQLVEETGAVVEGLNTSWVTKGPSFGSSGTVFMTKPKVAIAWDQPTSSLSAGNTRFVIEQQLGYPVTAIRSDTLASTNLASYDVLILPEGNYSQAVGQAGAQALNRWVSEGGVLIALGSATRFIADSDAALLNVQRELAYRENGAGSDGSGANTVSGVLFDEKADLAKSIIEPRTSPDFVAGVLANIEVDQEHWLTAGVSPTLVTVAGGNDIYTPIKLNSGKNLAWFADKDHVLASGYLWKQNQVQMAYKPVLIHQPKGRGMVIAYTQTPTFRAYLDGLNLLLANSIFRAAAHAN